MPDELHTALTLYRLARQMTPEELAARSGCSLAEVIAFEEGSALPTLRQLGSLGRALRVRPGLLLPQDEIQ